MIPDPQEEIVAVGECPSDDRWRQFLEGDVDADVTTELEGHLNLCPACQQTLASLSGDDVARQWRHLLQTAPENRESERNAAILRRIKEHPSSPHPLGDSYPAGSRIIFPDVSEPDAPLGRLGPFVFVEELGSGATGVVFRALDTELKRTVAIKVLRPELAVDRDDLARFKREARSAGVVQHPSVVAIYDVNRSDNFPLPYIVMEYVDGEPLGGGHRSSRSLDVREAVRIVGQVASGLAQAHEKGLVHLDVKPANILIDRHTGQAKLTDFGIARTILTGRDGTLHGVTAGHVVGTPPYMSPEQVLGQPVDARTDVYGLGATLYELLTGRPPFPAESSPEALKQICESDPVPLRRYRPALPRELEVICLKALSKNRSQRYATAGEFADDLDRFLSGRPILARSVGVPLRLLYWCHRNRAMAALLAVLFVVLTTSPVIFSLLWLNAVRSRALAESRFQEAQRSADDRDTVAQKEATGAAVRLYREHRDTEVQAALVRVPAGRRGWECRWLEAALARRPRAVELVDVNEWGIASILVSPDGRLAVTSGQDGRVIRYRLADGQATELASGQWSNELLRYRHFLPVVSVNSVLRKHRPEVAEREMQAPYPDCFITLCWVEPGVSVAGASVRGQGVIWDIATGTKRVLLTHDRPLQAVAASADGRLLLFGDDRGVLIRFDRTTARQDRTVIEGGPVSAIVPLPRGGWVVGQESGAVRVLGADGKPGPALTRVTGPVWGLDVAPDGRHLAAAGGQPSILLIELDGSDLPRLSSIERFRLPRAETQEPNAAHVVRFSPDGARLAAGDDLGRFMLWDMKSNELLFVKADQKRPGRIDSSGSAQVQMLPLPLRRRIAALAFLPDGKGCLTAGLDTGLRRWTLDSPDGQTTFPTAPGGLIEFDRDDPRILWVAAADGRLLLFDSVSGKPFGTGNGPAHEGPITGLSLASRSGLVATCGRDGMIRFWRRQGEQLHQAGAPVRPARPLRSVGLSPDGHRVVAYDADETLLLWDVASGRELGRQSLREAGPGRAVTGLVGFNADGTQVAALGPYQSCWRFSGSDLEVVKRAAVVAGSGGTALAWDPVDPGQLVAGDTIGRVRFDPPSGFFEPFDAPVVGLAFSPDGDRLAKLGGSGRISVGDPRKRIELLTLDDPHPAPTSVRFDPTGTRLAVVHFDGLVTIWETGPRPSTSPPYQDRAWSETGLRGASGTRDLCLRDKAIAIDRQDRVWLTYCRLSDRPGESEHYLVCLAHERTPGGRLEEEVLRDVGAITPTKLGDLTDSLALGLAADTAFAVETWPGDQYDNQMYLYRHPLHDRSGHPVKGKALFKKPENRGLFTTLLVDRQGQPQVLHFGYDGFYLYRTFLKDGTWETEPIGRQGDGFRHLAVQFPDGDIGLCFSAKRFNTDTAPLTFLRRGTTQVREVPSRMCTSASCLALKPDGNPVILGSTIDASGASELITLERTAEGRWTWKAGPPVYPIGVLNLVCDRNGTLYAASTDEDQSEINLLRCSSGTWSWEEVWKGSPFVAKGSEAFRAFLRLDSQSRPVIVVAVTSNDRGRLSVLRPAGGR
jgi:serine/threonine protein kinase/WD40 repeat protein